MSLQPNSCDSVTGPGTPIDARGTARLIDEKPQLAPPRNLYVYYPRTSVVSNKIAPRTLNRPHSITATVDATPTEPSEKPFFQM